MEIQQQIFELTKRIAELEKRDVIIKRLYHITELAQMTGLSTRALKGRRDRGQVKMNQPLGNDIFISAKEVERFVKWLESGC